MADTGSTSSAPTTHPDVLTILFDGKGGSEALPGDAPPEPVPDGAFVWQHLRLAAPDTQKLLRAADLDDYVIDALSAGETRPRCTVHGDGAIMNLRGVNLQEGAEVEDMISVRLWLTSSSVVGVWRRPLIAISDLLAAVERGHAPVSPGDFVARLALRLADRAEPAVADLNERVDELEEMLLDEEARIDRGRLAAVRRTSIILRRYLMPQRDALTTLEIEDLAWLGEHDRSRLREAAERIYRLGEDLDAIRDRAQIISDQLMDARAERLNAQMLVLSIVAAIFLPLSLLTGLLGINVGGVPGASDPSAFWIVTAIIVVIGAGLFVWARKSGMFR